MQTVTKFWSEEKKQVADLCEDKNCRLFWDNLQEMYFIIKQYPDGSILHTKETELFKSKDISQIRDFIKGLGVTPANNIKDILMDYDLKVKTQLLKYGFEHSLHGKICEDLSDIRNNVIKEINNKRS